MMVLDARAEEDIVFLSLFEDLTSKCFDATDSE